MTTTREVRRGERLLRLHQLVLLYSHRHIRSGIGYVELASDQQRSDLGGHECGHELEFWRIWMTPRAKAPLPKLHVCITKRSMNLLHQRPLIGCRRRERACRDGQFTRRDHDLRLTSHFAPVRLQSDDAVVAVELEVRERAKRLVRYGIQVFVERKDAGMKPLSLVARPMGFDPGAHHLLLVDMNRLVLCALFGATSVTHPDVGIESSEGFDRNLLEGARVAPRVEMHGATLRHDLASPRGGRGVNNSAPIRIA